MFIYQAHQAFTIWNKLMPEINDEVINLTFYCDADQYLPIRFFESWMNYITNMTSTGDNNVKN